ncbi:uncharacterized protein LOC122070560 [Macadamia integrifolia]|uniref:uncharacterized protein LOC122070560 n=1 Tax=Macadamia integrifolia TaxID=60698 RepID=UPI001C4EC393|nr:uncharacterized protein LOC122070560 [Macadamia integrifolia]
MQGWAKVTVAAPSAVVAIILLIVFIWRFCYSRRLTRITDTTKTRGKTFQSGIATLHLANDSKDRKSLPVFHHPDSKGKPNFCVLRHGVLPKSFFSWADHPRLVSEAVEYGWSRFAFTAHTSSPSTRSNLLGLCAAGDQVRETEALISWEVSPGSVDYIQKIRFNPGMKKIDMGTPPLGASYVIKSALPLPGPSLGSSNSSFPREAYLEITILSSLSEEEVDSVHSVKRSSCDGELKKLIPPNGDASVQSDSLIHVAGINSSARFQELKLRSKEGKRQDEPVMWSVGFSGGGYPPRKLPGSYPGSIGFNSNGSVYLDGIKLVFEAEKAELESRDKVVGCGFDPSQKKVFFTVDSELVHEIHCRSEEFGSPLYPTVAANVDVTVLVNFGQSDFKYLPANAQRTPNPCFIGTFPNGSADDLGYEDSREFFSMGRIDPLWLNRNNSKTINSNNSDNMTLYPDGESEAELFEIVLDSSSRSSTVMS